MDILIKNCNLISMSEVREKYEENIDILIQNNKIAKIEKNIEAIGNVKVIDACGKVCMPGLINTHTHLAMSIFRETLDGYTMQDWLEKKIWPMEDKLTREDIYYASLLSFIEMVSTGTVIANDMYYMTEETIKAANDIGARLQATRCVNDVKGNAEERIKELEKLINEYNGKYENITFNIGIHGLYTTGENTVKRCIEIAKKYGLSVHMHFCENEKEAEDIKSAYNVLKPTDVIEKYFSKTHTILAHAVKVTDEDIEALSKMDISIASCPVSNLRLGCGIAPIQKMINKGINISIGTDGQGSGSNLDLFEEMKFIALLQKIDDVKNMEAYDVLKMATINGAKALKIEDKIGSIDEGKEADIIILNLNNEICKPEGNIFSNIIYNVKGTNVETTIINGRIVMENRLIEGINKEEIFEKCKKIIQRIE